MGKDNVKRMLVWEKVADFLMDIAKYVLTAVIITSAAEDIGDNGWIKYGLSIAGSGLLLLWGILLHYYKNK